MGRTVTNLDVVDGRIVHPEGPGESVVALMARHPDTPDRGRGDHGPRLRPQQVWTSDLRRTVRQGFDRSRDRAFEGRAADRRLRWRPPHQPDAGAQPVHRRHGLGSRPGADGGEPDRRAYRRLDEPEPRRSAGPVPCRRRPTSMPSSSPRDDTRAHPIGIKGMGEIGVIGTPAAIANAVHHATGARLTTLPFRLDRLMAGP